MIFKYLVLILAFAALPIVAMQQPPHCIYSPNMPACEFDLQQAAMIAAARLRPTSPTPQTPPTPAPAIRNYSLSKSKDDIHC